MSQTTSLEEPAGPDEKDPQFAYTLAKGLEVLKAFGTGDSQMSNKAIADATGIARTTVARLTRTLSLMGYLKYDAKDAQYRMAAPLLCLVHPLLVHLTIRQMARPLMQRLANHSNGAVSLAMRHGLDMVIVESCVDENAFSGRPDIGTVRALPLTAFGRAYLAGAAPAERQEIFADIEADPRYDLSDLNLSLHEEIQRHAKLGYCVARDTARTGIHAVAVPLRSGADSDLMVVNCAVASYQLKGDELERDYGPRLVDLVRTLGATVTADHARASR